MCGRRATRPRRCSRCGVQGGAPRGWNCLSTGRTAKPAWAGIGEESRFILFDNFFFSWFWKQIDHRVSIGLNFRNTSEWGDGIHYLSFFFFIFRFLPHKWAMLFACADWLARCWIATLGAIIVPVLWYYSSAICWRKTKWRLKIEAAFVSYSTCVIYRQLFTPLSMKLPLKRL